MIKADIMETIRERANVKGFEFVQDSFGSHIKDGTDWSCAWVNFVILENPIWNERTPREIKVNVTVKASVSRMGGDTTVEDLLKASDTIKRAAELVEELNGMNLQYVEKF